MMRTTARPQLGLAAAALVIALALVGCTSPPAVDAPPGESGTSPAVTTLAPSATPSVTPSPTPEPTPKPPRRTAANGTDYAACNDGDCEVAVSKPLTFKLDEEFKLSISKVTKKNVEFSLVGTGYEFGGTFAGRYCLAKLSASGFQSSCADKPGKRPRKRDLGDGQLALELLDLTDGVAIIRLTSG